jgi:hypothetical protein
MVQAPFLVRVSGFFGTLELYARRFGLAAQPFQQVFYLNLAATSCFTSPAKGRMAGCIEPTGIDDLVAMSRALRQAPA